MKKGKLLLVTVLISIISFGFDSSNEKIFNSDYKIEKIDQNTLEKLIKNRNGKVLFLNVWATWCAPCREEFPDIVKLVDKHKNSKVDFIGLSVDYPDEVDSKIIPFLKKYKANFKTYVNDFDDVEDLINSINKKWNGAIPATFIYDKNGIQQKYILGMRNFDEFDKELTEVLKKSSK
jgi:thiol-disulfide isomerase/thioredoxin